MGRGGCCTWSSKRQRRQVQQVAAAAGPASGGGSWSSKRQAAGRNREERGGPAATNPAAAGGGGGSPSRVEQWAAPRGTVELAAESACYPSQRDEIRQTSIVPWGQNSPFSYPGWIKKNKKSENAHGSGRNGIFTNGAIFRCYSSNPGQFGGIFLKRGSFGVTDPILPFFYYTSLCSLS